MPHINFRTAPAIWWVSYGTIEKRQPSSGVQSRLQPRLVGLLIVYCVVFAFLTGCATAPLIDYDGGNKLEFARRLGDANRFQEACSVLELEVARRGDDRAAFRALLMLAEFRERQGDDAAAAIALKRAEAMRASALGAAASGQPGRVDSPESGTGSEAPNSSPSEEGQSTKGLPDPGLTRISNSFFDTDLRQVLSDLSFDAGVPILSDPTVQGIITYEAIDQPLEDVLKAVLIPLGYMFIYADGSYLVGSAKPDSPAFSSLSQTRVVTLANIEAEQAIQLLSDFFMPYVKASSSGNLVCITAPPSLADRISRDLKTIDAPRDLIMIEVIMAEITETGMRQIGIDWSASGPSGEGTWDVGTNLDGLGAPGIIGTIEHVGHEAIDWTARLEALVMAGKAEIRASPRITTLNGRPAGISLTKDQYFIIQTGSGMGYQYNTLESVSSGIKLEITPFVSEGDEVTVYVKPEVGDVTGNTPTSELPEISWRRASTAVRVKNGETFSIGGLNLEQEKTVRRQIPLLGSIPLLGRIFRFESTESKKSEVVVFLTPHVLKS